MNHSISNQTEQTRTDKKKNEQIVDGRKEMKKSKPGELAVCR